MSASHQVTKDQLHVTAPSPVYDFLYLIPPISKDLAKSNATYISLKQINSKRFPSCQDSGSRLQQKQNQSVLAQALLRSLPSLESNLL